MRKELTSRYQFKRSGTFLICLVLLCLVQCSVAQQIITIRAHNFGKYNEIFLNDSVWSFHPGELPAGRPPANSMQGWDTLHHTIFGKANAPAKWSGMGWFGVWIRVDTALVNQKLFVRINHDGASEIFIDGRPIGGYGQVGYSAQQMVAMRAPRELIPVWFADTHSHLLVIRYSNYFGVYPDFLGFEVSVGDYALRAKKLNAGKRLLDYLPMFAAAQLILGLLHFLFFLFYPRQKLNAYYALFVLLIGINGIAVYQYYLTPYPSVQYLAEFATFACKVLIMWSAVLLLYVLNYQHIPRWRMIALTVITLSYLTGYVLKFWVFRVEFWTDYFSITYLVCMMDGLWSASKVIRRGRKDAWLIGTGVLTIILVYFFAWDDTFLIWPYDLNAMRLFVMGAGSLVLPLCLSLYLALDFARTNQRLAVKLQEVESLSALALARETERAELIADEARKLEQIVEQRTAEIKQHADKLLEMDTLKSHFFTNIAHELKTPLTLILNPAKVLLHSFDNNSSSTQNLRLIIDNAERLLQLINQLLDLSKMESGLMKVDLQALDLVKLVKRQVSACAPMALQKGITLEVLTGLNTFWLLSDRDKMEKILLNLLSNAMKFTDNGSISITLSQDLIGQSNTFSLTVRDTGKGIPAAKLPFIFTRFYQADPTDTRSAGGTGVGLSLTKELVELMGGQLLAESEEGQYTQIRIDMPYESTNEVIAQGGDDLPENAFSPSINTEKQLVTYENCPIVLLVEDNEDLRTFIANSLAESYRLITAADGEEGIALGLQYIPSLIITDLMMPKISGYEVCETLKNDARTSHIPILMLTAKTGLDSRIHGIEKGADAYLAKPFDQRELLAIMNSLISQREKLRLLYSNNDLWLKEPVTLPSVEQQFMMHVRQAISNHLNEEGYSADQLASDMGLSRTQLHRKLKGLMGKAPGELIRIIRLQYAHDLLERRVASISEVAYMVGFSSPASFSASFSRHFGFAPSKVVDTEF